MTEQIVQPLILIISLIALASASHFAILFIEKLIELTGLSEASAGFIILAVFTSTPEIIVALFAVSQGNPGISVGDILGSNIFNVGIVLGILAILGYLTVCCTNLLVELSDMLFVATSIPLLMVISYYHIFNISSPIVGVILLGAFFVNTYLILRKKTPPVKVHSKEVETENVIIVVAKMVVAMTVVILAARFVVSSGIEIAGFLGVPPILIGAKVVAIGTSLPELTLDFTAVRRGHIQLAIGDIIGSNLTNLTLVLGLVLLTSPFSVEINVFTEILPFLLITTIIFWRFLVRGGVSKVGGVALILMYILFQVLVV